MKISSYILFTWCIFLQQIFLQAQEARLSYELQQGAVYTMEIEIQQNTSSESMNSEDISMYSQMQILFRVDSLSSDHSLISCSVRYNKLLLSMLAPGMGIDINSETGKNPILSNLMDSLQVQWFHLQMDESGRLKTIGGLDEIFQELSSRTPTDIQKSELAMGTLMEAYGPDAFRSLFNLFISIYPAVQPIQNWTNDLTYYFNTKPVRIENRYYLTKSSSEMLTIQGMGMINSIKEFTETIPLGEVTSKVSGTQTYDIHTDVKTGWIKKCISRQRLVIETTVLKSDQLPAGLKIPSYTETLFEIKGSVQSLILQ